MEHRARGWLDHCGGAGTIAVIAAAAASTAAAVGAMTLNLGGN